MEKIKNKLLTLFIMSIIAVMSLMVVANSGFALIPENMQINGTVNDTLNITGYNSSDSNIIEFNIAINDTINQTNRSYDLMPPEIMPRYEKRYTSINKINNIYPADNVLNINKGTVSVWMYMQKNYPRKDHLIFQTDDSRLALYFDTFYSAGAKKTVTRIAARAGGTHRANDSGYVKGNFPEASIIIDNDGSLSTYGSTTKWYSPAKMPEGEWNLITMTWDGYPEGIVKIYLNGKLIGQKKYDSRYDDNRPLFKTFAVGYRPYNWKGEIIEMNGMTYEGKPSTEMKLSSGGLKIKDMRIYKDVLPESEVLELYNEGLCDDCKTIGPKEVITEKKEERKYKIIGNHLIKDRDGYDNKIKKLYIKEKHNENIRAGKLTNTKKQNEKEIAKKYYEKNNGIYKKEKHEDGSCKGGCELEGKCVSYGLRFKDGKAIFCDFDGKIKKQKKENELCQNNFECESNSCISGRCIDLVSKVEKNTNLLNKIISWFSRFF